jgi:hypothetical protein
MTLQNASFDHLIRPVHQQETTRKLIPKNLLSFLWYQLNGVQGVAGSNPAVPTV